MRDGKVDVTEAKIGGEVKVGQTLTATANKGATNVKYQWKIADTKDGEYKDIASATNSTLKLEESQKGKFIKVVISGDNASTVTSEATNVIAAADAKVDVTEAKIGGEAKVGQTLTATANKGATNVKYQWKIADTKDGEYKDIASATNSTLKLEESQKGKFIKVVISGDNASTVTSEATNVIAAADLAKVDVTKAKIGGEAKVGQTLTATANKGATNVKYQWKIADTKDGEYKDIASATNSTLKLEESQKGKFIKVVISGDNASTATSEATDAVAEK